MARNREIRLNYVGAFLGLPTSSVPYYADTAQPCNSLHATARVNQTGNYDSPHPRTETAGLDTDASLLSAAAILTQQGRITAVWHEHSRQ
jgi:hypothetical protein